jgi:hypothetical protein
MPFSVALLWLSRADTGILQVGNERTRPRHLPVARPSVSSKALAATSVLVSNAVPGRRLSSYLPNSPGLTRIYRQQTHAARCWSSWRLRRPELEGSLD